MIKVDGYVQAVVPSRIVNFEHFNELMAGIGLSVLEISEDIDKPGGEVSAIVIMKKTHSVRHVDFLLFISNCLDFYEQGGDD